MITEERKAKGSHLFIKEKKKKLKFRDSGVLTRPV